MDPEIIIGIDPGTRITGYGVIAKKQGKMIALDYGCIRPPVKAPLEKRYLVLFEAVCGLLDRFSPHAFSIETQYIDHAKNVQSVLKLGRARGVIELAASLRKIPIFEYAPSRAKRAVVGRGSASKAQVQGMIKALLSLSVLPEPEDAADALALALCHAHQERRCTTISVEL